MMTLFLAGIGSMLLSGLAALGLSRYPRAAQAAGAGGAILGSLLAFYPALRVLLTGAKASFQVPWQVPYGSLAIGLDPLSAFFLLPISGLSALCAVYGVRYLAKDLRVLPIGLHWFFFNLLIAGMALVVTARNGMLFLMAWEIMSLASFFLVTFEHAKPGVQNAGWVYLAAMNLGALCLLAFFIFLGQPSGSMDFSVILSHGRPAVPAGLLFLLAFLGFGVKAGLVPMHIWLPEAHPAAPSHVSALMSGVMIKTGIYGLLRFMPFLGNPAEWWGYLLLGAGVVSAVLGVVFALAQHDLKRLLAYSSVENIGIIATGVGLGVLGRCWQEPVLMALGFGGGLLHVVNHAFFKGLLFLGAGSVLHSTGSAEFNCLGGLLKRMPLTGMTFFIGAAAICGLPPFNGFISEFLIYLGAFQGGMTRPPVAAGLLWLVLAGLAMTGGLAAACFAKAFGIAFLGEPRTPVACQAHESGWAMTGPMLLLALGCTAIGLSGPLVLRLLIPVITQVCGQAPAGLQPALAGGVRLTSMISGLTAVLVLLTAGLLGWRRWLLAKHPREGAGTWDCGFIQATPRMQYTAASFSQPITSLFQKILRVRRVYQAPKGYFPDRAALQTETEDMFLSRGFQSLFRGTAWVLSRLRWIQHGRVQIYVLYIAVTLLVLLVWKLR